MKRKILKTLIILVFCLALAAQSAFALTEGDWEYTILNSQAIITKYIGAGGSVNIPSTLSGLPVTSIEQGAFMSNKEIVSVTIPPTVTKIGDDAFRYCSKLETVTIPNSVTTLGGYVFYDCTSLVSCPLPDSITSIGGSNFHGCKSLVSSNYPSGIKEIAGAYRDGFWAGCESLTSIYLPEGLEVIGSVAFSDCTSLESVSLPQSLKTIGMSAFSGCTSLKDINLNAGLRTIESYAFNETKLSNIILPVTLNKIGINWTFHEHTQEEIVLPYGLEIFGSSSFESDTLKALYVPSTVTSFGIPSSLSSFSSNCPNAIIYCPEGSYAAQICERDKVSYIIDNSVDCTLHVLYNGRRISFDQNPEIIDGRTLVPLRAIFETMGATVDWNAATRTVTASRGGTAISLTVGSNTMFVNASAVTLDVPATILGDRTMVPARAIAEGLSAKVDWDQAGRLVLITE